MVDRFTNVRFEPAGMTDDPDVRMAQSLLDYVFRRLALDYLDFDIRSYMGFTLRKSGLVSWRLEVTRPPLPIRGDRPHTIASGASRTYTQGVLVCGALGLERCGWNPLSKRRQSAPPGYGGAFGQ